MALVLAVQRFKIEGAAKWSTYATIWAKGRLSHELDIRRALKRGGHLHHVALDEARDAAVHPPDIAPTELHLFVLTPGQRDAIDGVMRGETSDETAVRLGCSVVAVRLRRKMAVQRLRRAHDTLRRTRSFDDLVDDVVEECRNHVKRTRRDLPPLDAPKAIELYVAGWSSRAIASELNSSAPTVLKAVREAGVERRPQNKRSPQHYAVKEGAA